MNGLPHDGITEVTPRQRPRWYPWDVISAS